MAISLLLLAALVGLINAGGEQSRIYQGPEVHIDQCDVEVDERLRCGTVTRDERECQTRGCCFRRCEGCERSVPWCYLAHRMVADECMVAYEEKDDCGYFGITEGECMMRGCCWQPSHSGLPNDPWCFAKKTIKLVGGADSSEGRVELVHDGRWGTVCDDGWNNADADVVCRQMGYQSGRAYRGAYFGAGEGQIWLDEVDCSGDESSIDECNSYGWGNHDCSHGEDAGVKCDDEEGSGSEWAYYY